MCMSACVNKNGNFFFPAFAIISMTTNNIFVYLCNILYKLVTQTNTTKLVQQ